MKEKLYNNSDKQSSVEISAENDTLGIDLDCPVNVSDKCDTASFEQSEQDFDSKPKSNETDDAEVNADADNIETPSESSSLVPSAEYCTIVADVKQHRRDMIDKIIMILLWIAIGSLILALVLKFFVVGQITIRGESMMPNYVSGQKVWVNKLAKPKRGDVVVFYPNGNPTFIEKLIGNAGEGGIAQKYIKRVVALEGDSLWVEEYNGDYVLVIKTAAGQILYEDGYTVNGQPAQFYDADQNLCTTAYLRKKLFNLDNTSESDPYVVAEGCFYALGDNRLNSHDCRNIGSVPISQIYGVVI